MDYASTVRNLIDAADGLERQAERETDADRANGFRASAANYRERAETIMDKYRIAEEEAIASGATDVTPAAHDIRLYTGGTDLSGWYTDVFRAIIRHTGVRFALRWDNGYIAEVVGYEGDVRYTEFLWTAALLMFSTRIDPRWDSSVPEAENIYRLRGAGVKRREIADKAWGNGYDAAARSKVQRVYAAECARRGEPVAAAGLGFNGGDYRSAYARGFYHTLRQRLQMARDAADSVGGGVVLHGRIERVDEAFYTLFPSYRPSYEPVTPSAPAKPCPRCAAAKSGHCREHPAYAVTKADLRRWDREANSPSARAGVDAGARAAEGVVITRGHTSAARLDPSGKAIGN